MSDYTGNKPNSFYKQRQKRAFDLDFEPQTNNQIIILQGVIETVTFHNAENGFTVAKMSVSGKKLPITVVGILHNPAQGQELELTGQWITHAKFGRQFSFTSNNVVLPVTKEGIIKYLGGGLVPGIGPKTAARIVEVFGSATLDVLDKDMQRLQEVEGVGRHKLKLISEGWQKQQAMRKVMAFLSSYGIGPKTGLKIVNKYGKDAAAQVRENPYALSEDISGIGFKIADTIAGELGISRESLTRIQAGLLYSLRQGSDQGHLYLPYEELVTDTCKLLGLERSRVTEGFAELATTRRVIIEDLNQPGSDFIPNNKAVYLPMFYWAEKGLALQLHKLAGAQTAGIDASSKGDTAKGDTAKGDTLETDTTTRAEAGRDTENHHIKAGEKKKRTAVNSLHRVHNKMRYDRGGLLRLVGLELPELFDTSVKKNVYDRGDDQANQANQANRGDDQANQANQANRGDDQANQANQANRGDDHSGVPINSGHSNGHNRGLYNPNTNQGDHQFELQTIIKQVQQSLGIKLAERQQEALYAVLDHNVVVITGGPGTGKTTIIQSILKLFTLLQQQIYQNPVHQNREKPHIPVYLTAPTGRAAKRMSETSGMEAKTIHRLLEYSNKRSLKKLPKRDEHSSGSQNMGTGKGMFLRNQENPLNKGVFIVDEVSMIDCMLMYQLLRAIPAGAVLVLVGDIDQLPSVGPGTVLQDIIHSNRFPVVQLNEIFRQAQESGIVVNAHRINQGLLPISGSESNDTNRDELRDFYFIEEDDPRRVQETIVKLTAERVPKRFHLDPFQDIQVLTPMYKGPAGAEELNQVLRQELNPPRSQTPAGNPPESQKSSQTSFQTPAGNPPESQKSSQTSFQTPAEDPAETPAEDQAGQDRFRRGDKVMQIRNNYEREVFNGDIGRVAKTDDENNELTVLFDNREVKYFYHDLDELVSAYAITVHKSQGSEYPGVIIPLTTQHYILLKRNLLYTGITRGKQLVVLVGSKKALRLAVKNNDTQHRYSLLKERLIK